MFSANTSQVAAGGGVNYIEDVFSTYLYTGTGATNNIVNGVDLATYGGLVWTKARTTTSAFTFAHALIDTLRGAGVQICSDRTDANYTQANSLTGFNTNGYTLGTDSGGQGRVNNTSYGTQTYVSWTFAKAPKFFDVVTYTGNGTAGNAISHNLGSAPGCIIVKRTDTGGTDWYVYHRSLGNSSRIELNLTDAAFSGATVWNSQDPTSTQFFLGSGTGVNGSGGTYVAYLFAHNAGGFGLTGTDNVISCGSFTTDGSGNFSVNLGYEPQWILAKQATGSANNWCLFDNMRGMSNTNVARLIPNSSSAETNFAGPYCVPSATGFYSNSGGFFDASQTVIYIAIRRGPMKVPTSGTSVYNADTTITATTPAAVSGFVTDLMISTNRTNKATYNEMFWSNRLTANGYTSSTNTTAEQAGGAFGAWDTMNGSGTSALQSAGVSDMAWMFRRAPSFFDEVCYTGTGSALTVSHNLGAVPEIIIIKRRSSAASNNNWYTGWNMSGPTYMESLLNTSDAGTLYTYPNWFTSTPTTTTFAIAGGGNVNANTATYVAYLFATCAGVSKVGSYTGNGSTQTINCGFTGGARFVLIKRTDSTGDWYTYDTARGMTTLTDPYLLLNSTAAESATLGSVTTVSTGFALNAGILAAINTNAASYIFFAVA